MSKLVIKRSLWLRGEGGRNSYLRRGSDGKMCCLGMLGVSLGATEEQLTDYSSPSELSVVPWTEGLLWRDGCSTDTCKNLMFVNDDRNRVDTDREVRLTLLFSEIGIEVEFVD